MGTKEICVKAMNKLCYYMANYNLVEIEVAIHAYAKPQKRSVPDFFKAFDPYLVPHLLQKWDKIDEGAFGNVLAFYFELDSIQRGKMLNYILENYNSEINVNTDSSPED